MPVNSQPPGISLFFPAYNDARVIGALVERAFSVLPQLTANYEVIVVNDGSTDNTSEVLRDLALVWPQLRIVTHSRNCGYGAALRSGFKHATKELVFYTDGDGQYDVNELPSLYACLTETIDVVNGFKIKRADRVSRRIAGALYNRLARWLFRLPVRDVDCDFRLLRSQRVRQLQLTSSSGAICVELVAKLRDQGCTFSEVAVNHYPRLHGRSQFFRPRRLITTAMEFSKLWWQLMVLSVMRRESHFRLRLD